MKDRLPPCDIEAEKAVIGACLNEPSVRIPEAALVIVEPSFFYDLRFRTIWEVMLAMRPDEVNIITLAARLKMSDAFKLLSDCQDAAFSAANLPSWLAIVQDKFTLRRIIQICLASVASAYNSDQAGLLLDEVEREVLKIRPARQNQQDIHSLLRSATDLIEFRAQNWDKITGLTTGIHSLDKKTDGLHKGEFVVVAALPSCGKTALSVNIGVYNALAGVPVGILSAEMRPVQLVVRSICSESRKNFKKISEGDIPALVGAVGRLDKSPLFIEQISGFTVGQVIALARRLKQSAGIQLLIVDYIQLISGQGDNREQQVASVGRGLKAIAAELDIPVVGISQLNDEGRLRESRAIGQDADSIWMLENEGEWNAESQPVILKVTKCRDGETGAVPLIFLKTITRFEMRAHEDEGRNPYAD